MPQVELSTGRLVVLAPEFGPDESLRAAEFSEVPAQMTRADSILLNYASIYVAIESVDGKTPEDFIPDSTEARDILMGFRKLFSAQEWDEVVAAFDEVYADPKPAKGAKPVGKGYKIIKPSSGSIKK